tara:strand:- start:134 stop:1042 length:909 start_codon:yes stop_codon:yes gene_type:complete
MNKFDVIFSCLPHGETQKVFVKIFSDFIKSSGINESIYDFFKKNESSFPRIIDLSADFRLSNSEIYEKHYIQNHRMPEFLNEAVYGLSEIYKSNISRSKLVACPGCYPTSVLLPLIPLIKYDVIRADEVIIDSKSGVTGAGKALRESSLYSELAEGFHAYGVTSHRHGPEIDQELSKFAEFNVVTTFTPHLVPMNRGIFSTIYVKSKNKQTIKSLREAINETYKDEKFVLLLKDGQVPSTKFVRGSNMCFIGVFEDKTPGKFIIFSVIDNLIKGASGQAVQNMNLMFNLPEDLGLDNLSLFP